MAAPRFLFTRRCVAVGRWSPRIDGACRRAGERPRPDVHARTSPLLGDNLLAGRGCGGPCCARAPLPFRESGNEPCSGLLMMQGARGPDVPAGARSSIRAEGCPPRLGVAGHGAFATRETDYALFVARDVPGAAQETWWSGCWHHSAGRRGPGRVRCDPMRGPRPAAVSPGNRGWLVLAWLAGAIAALKRLWGPGVSGPAHGTTAASPARSRDGGAQHPRERLQAATSAVRQRTGPEAHGYVTTRDLPERRALCGPGWAGRRDGRRRAGCRRAATAGTGRRRWIPVHVRHGRRGRWRRRRAR